MKTNNLEFERPIAELEAKVAEIKAQAAADGIDMAAEVATLESRVGALQEQVYSNLTRWQKYQIAGHPRRPHTLDYVDMLLSDFVELHGDRSYRDDPAVVGGLGSFGDRALVVIGHQKGRNTKENLDRNFGMAHPEGYRKALRLMRLAAKFGKPILCFVDTPGAYPGIGSEKRSVSEAIARNMLEMSRLPTPIIVVISGEGASGGAIGIGVGDRILMLENAWYSVINPQSCSLILWRTRDKREEAAEALKITGEDLTKLGVVDRVVAEPMGGAHRDPLKAGENLKQALAEELKRLCSIPPEELVRKRLEKFRKMGVWEE